MSLYYNEPKGDAKYATIGGSLDNANTRRDFEEAQILKQVDDYILYGWFTHLTDLINFRNKDWNWSPQLARITFHSSRW